MKAAKICYVLYLLLSNKIIISNRIVISGLKHWGYARNISHISWVPFRMSMTAQCWAEDHKTSRLSWAKLNNGRRLESIIEQWIVTLRSAESTLLGSWSIYDLENYMWYTFVMYPGYLNHSIGQSTSYLKKSFVRSHNVS